MPVKFSYMYRDGANYKNHSEVIMQNPENISIAVALEKLASKLIDGMYFYAHELQLPDLHFPHWNDQYDHSWHEFVSLEETSEAPTIHLNLKEFLDHIKTHHTI